MSGVADGLDHRAFARALPVRTRRELTQLRDAPGLMRLASHIALIAALGLGVAMRAPGWPLLMAALGVALVFLFTAMHEASHRTAFATPRLNDAVLAGVGLILLLPPEWFRLFHAAHHRHTQDPDKDPELATPKPRTRRAYLIHVSGLTVWRAQIAALLRNAAGRCDDAYVPPSARPRVAREARVMLTLYAGVAAAALLAGSAAPLTLWLGPLLLGQPALRLYLLAEHGRCPQVADMFANSRTTFTARAVRWLAWNMPYHAEHHALPTVPFHALPRLHALSRPHLKCTERGYGRFNRRFWADLVG
ncbi:MAG: fatty acid desaturase [Pseudomonadota bacterium]